MSERDTMPFSAVLAALAESEDISIPLLFRLSDMTAAEMSAFWETWAVLPTEKRQSIVRHLADISEDNFQVDFAPVLARCLEDSDSLVRQAALDGLWDCTDTRLARRIIALLEQDPVAAVRAAAAAALAHYVLMIEWGQVPAGIKPEIVGALLAQWDNPSSDAAMRRAVVEALGPSAHPRVGGIIETAYQSRDADLRKSAIFAMGSSADPRWLSIVIEEMENPDNDMRAEAARAAGAIGRSDAVAGLGELLRDDDLVVLQAAVAALSQIGSDEARRLLTLLQEELEEDGDEDLLELLDEALEEMDWFGGDTGLSLLDWGGPDDDDDDFLDLDV